MLAESLQGHLLGKLFAIFCRRKNGDDVTVRYRGVHQNTRRINMRHDGHEIQSLMGRRFFHLERIG